MHSETLRDLDEQETAALSALLDLATLPNIEIAETGGGGHPRLVLDPESEERDAHEAAIWKGRDIVRYGSFRVDAKAQFVDWVADVTALDRSEWATQQTVRDELLSGIAHMAVSHDLFVTTSPRLLTLRDNQEFIQHHQHMAGINPRLPSEAVKIAALFQRSRDEYRPREFVEDQFPQITVYRYLFYSTIAYDRTPEAMRFESASGRAQMSDDTYYLAKSVVQRLIRLLEACDALGILFYTPNSDDIVDRVMSHFDYLNLIVTGAFDALARMAHRVYKVTSPAEYRAGFQHEKFRQAILRAGGTQLDQVASDAQFQDYLFVIGKLRNTIHGRAIEGQRIGSIENLNMGFVVVPDDQAVDIWNKFANLGNSDVWGGRQVRPMSSATKNPYSLTIEPYTYALKAVDECMRYANRP